MSFSSDGTVAGLLSDHLTALVFLGVLHLKVNKSTACGCQRSAANSKSKKGHNCAKNILRVTSPIGMSSPFS